MQPPFQSVHTTRCEPVGLGESVETVIDLKTEAEDVVSCSDLCGCESAGWSGSRRTAESGVEARHNTAAIEATVIEHSLYPAAGGARLLHVAVGLESE